MSAQIKLILNNLDPSQAQNLTLINPEEIFEPYPQLQYEGFHNSYIKQQSWCKYSSRKQIHSDFPASVTTKHVALFLSKEKNYTRAMIEHLIALLGKEAILWLVGHNKAGAKSAGNILKQFFANWRKLDLGGHCTLWEASNPIHNGHTASKTTSFQINIAGQNLTLVSLPGVFSHGHIDAGTRLLLQSLPDIHHHNMLDFGCGNGIISLFQAQKNPESQFTLVDDSALALHAAKLSMKEFSHNTHFIPSIDQVSGNFDLILSNPPFHQGIHQTLDISLNFIQKSASLLTKQGELYLVANRFLAYADTLEQHFSSVSRLAENRQYIVWHASSPKP
ncbi:MAG: methyltransferase [bacterium]